jgi:hypothetical protein
MLDWLKRRKTSAPGVGASAHDHEAAQVFDVGNGLHVHLSAFYIKLTNRDLPCWVYRSDGLRQWNHTELVFAVPRDAAPTPPQDPVYHTQVVGSFAAKDRA